MSEPNPAENDTRVRPARAPDPDTHHGETTGGGPRSSSASRAVPPPLLGRFQVRQVLGEGAFGRVYLAFDPELERSVAVKVPHREGLTPAFRERFLREARATATIHHPNVCPVYEVGTEGELPFLVMHFVPGTTLAAMLDRLADPLPPRRAVAIARKLALGTAAAHARGVIHRDLKPQNVLCDDATGEVFITDFGLARIGSVARMTADGAIFGTPAYMSPEQARGKMDEVGPHSDVYALGVILYRMLAGEVPFTGSVFEVMVQHWQTPPRPPSEVRPDLDPDLDAIVLKAMAKAPADRYPSAQALAAALGEYLRGENLEFASELPAEPATRRAVPPPLPAARPFAQTEPLSLDDDDDPPAPVRSRGWLWAGAAALAAVACVAAVAYALIDRKPEVIAEKPSNPPAAPPVAKLKAGDVFTLTFGDPAVEMRFRWVPAGSFTMGKGNDRYGSDQGPAHRVTISNGYWMAETEVTQAQWKTVMGTNPSKVTSDSLPVESVAWYSANKFCDELSKLVGKSVSLPTEAQWEYACRAGTAMEYHSGNSVAELEQIAWCAENSQTRPHPVGLKAANAWHLRDMHGNVAEWCHDGGREYNFSDQTDPREELDKADPRAIVRGGSFVFNSSVTDRRRFSLHASEYVGFRVCWHQK